MINLMKESAFAPKARIATLTTRFLKDGAQSLNGRIYPKEAVDALVHSGALTASNPSATLLTCYTSHGAAERDDVNNLTGKITKVWREGDEAFASFDVPDTSSGRDMVSLIKGGYLKTMSLRARGAQLKMQHGQSVPIVGGNLELEGIDFTTRPGIQVAQIQNVLVESAEPQSVVEVFDLPASNLILEEISQEKPDPLTEASIEALLTEMGKRLSGATTKNLVDAHDAVARTLGMECEGSYGDDNPLDPANDGKETTMTKEEALKLLQEAGYDVSAPKSEAQKLQEVFEAKLAEQDAARKVELEESNKRFEELKALIITKQATPQRTSLVEGATTTEKQPPTIYKKGSYVTEKLRGVPLEDLADRTKPLPDGIQEEHLLKEFGHLMLLDPSRYPSPMNSVLRD